MLEGIFEINSYEIDDLLSYISNTANDVESTNDEAKVDFDHFKKSEVFGKGAQKLNDQMDSIFNSIDSLGIVMKKGTSFIFETEMKILEEARDLEIPMGFATNDVVTNKSASSVNLTKNDGRSVNDGVASSTINPEINSSVEKENLENINNNVTERQDLDEGQITDHSTVLENINGNETVAQHFEDNYDMAAENLNSINQNTQEIPTENDVEINAPEKITLASFNNTPAPQENTDFNINMNSENIDLGSMNNTQI